MDSPDSLFPAVSNQAATTLFDHVNKKGIDPSPKVFAFRDPATHCACALGANRGGVIVVVIIVVIFTLLFGLLDEINIV